MARFSLHIEGVLLARRLILILTVGILTVIAVETWYDFREDVSAYQTAMVRELRTLAVGMGVAFSVQWETFGEAAALRLIERVNRGDRDVDLRWVWLDEARPDPNAQGPAAPLEEARRLAASGGYTVRATAGGGERLLIYDRVDVGAARAGALEVSQSLAPLRVYQHARLIEVVTESAIIVAICAAIVLTLGLFFIGQPIRTLTAMARRIGAGDFNGRLFFRRKDEISELADEMNLMSELLAADKRAIEAETKARLEALAQVRHGDRLATVGRLAAGVAHELGTPLNVISGRAKMIRGDEEALRNARIIVDQAERMAVIIRQLLDFARRKGPSLGPVDLQQLVRQTLTMLTPLAEKAGVALHFEIDAHVPTQLRLDQNQIQQALTNLILNGVQATHPGGAVTVRLTTEAVGPDQSQAIPGLYPGHGPRAQEYVCLRVIDDGTGIAPDLVPHLFEPFFTTKDVGEGTGLGLPVAHGIIADHRGFITVESELGKGSTLAIYLPTDHPADRASAA